MPEPEIDPGRPTPPPPGNGTHYEEPQAQAGVSAQQAIRMILQSGFAGWKTPIAMTRPTQHGPEKYETTPAQIMAENTRAMLALNHTLITFMTGAVQCEAEDENGQTVIDEVNPIQALVDLTAAIDESCSIAEQQMNRKPRKARKRRKT